VGQAQAAYDIARQKYEALLKSSHKAALNAAQGQLQSAKGKLQEAQAQLSYTSLRSPIAGVVTDRPLFPGDTVAAGTPIVTVMDTGSLIAKLHVAQALAQQLQVGSEATLTIPGMEEPVKAKVSLISPALDPGSTTIEVWLKVPNAKGALRAGTTVHATLEGRTVKQALLVPADAVQRSPESGGKMVMVIGPDGLAHKKNVTIGISARETTQILSGLSVGDMVITGGAYGLDEGTKVKIEAAKPDADDAAKPAPGEKE
jgi:RND family efflux transporter MFP subunit